MLDKISRGFALFMNWFNGICAPLCGLWMMASALWALPVSWNDFMPVELIEPLPLPAFMEADFFWSGLALLLVNGVPNIVALVVRFRGNLHGSYCIGMIAGAMLIAWTVFEMVFIPNGLSVFYMILGVLQLAASWKATKSV